MMRWLRPRHRFIVSSLRYQKRPPNNDFQVIRSYTTRPPLQKQNDNERPSSQEDLRSQTSPEEEKPISKSAIDDLGRVIRDDFARFRDHYDVPRHPIVLAHGLMGFDELRLAGRWLPGVQYWRGIKEALMSNGIRVITTSVPTTGSIQERAEALYRDIKAKVSLEREEWEIDRDKRSTKASESANDDGGGVNIVAHSMGGLDARYLISTIRPTEFRVRSLTTIATPHRGSSAADWILREVDDAHLLDGLYKVLKRIKVDSDAFGQLTRRYITTEFNPRNRDDAQVRYFSYGASATPSIFSVFRFSHDIMMELEGPNDGLVSVASSKWGSDDGYKGTLMGVTHLDLINWTNRLKRLAADLTLMKQDFNAVAFYLAIADMLAKEGL